MTKRRYRWQDMKRSAAAYGNFTAAGPVTVIKADGTVEQQAAFNDAQTIGIKTNTQRHRGEKRPERGARNRRPLIARFTSRCNDCGSVIHEGDRYGWNPVEHKGFCLRCAAGNPNIITSRGRNTRS